MRLAPILALLAAPALARVQEAVEEVALQHFGAFADAAAAAALARAARDDCASAALHAPWNAAFDARLAVAPFPAGPAERDGLGPSIAFRPDTREATACGLAQLFADGADLSPDAVARASVAGRGLFAPERLPNDPPACDATRALSADRAVSADRLRDAWADGYADALMKASAQGNATFFTAEEAVASLYSALRSELQFVEEQRLGRPMGEVDAPRPTRAGAWRSGRAQRNVVVSLRALRVLADALATAPPTRAAFDRAIASAEAPDDPAFAAVADPGGRFRLESLQQQVATIRPRSDHGRRRDRRGPRARGRLRCARRRLTRRRAAPCSRASPRRFSRSWAGRRPGFPAAAREVGSGHALFGLGADLSRTFRIPLPDRGHAAAAHPHWPLAVAFARRPGTFALVIDCAAGRIVARLDAPAGRHFYGHGTFLADGAVLATTENACESGAGRIGFRDATAGFTRKGEAASGGIGPHEMLRLPGSDTLAVANGGIRTHPRSEREKLNVAAMRPNLAWLDANGSSSETVEFDPVLRMNSIRHLSAAAAADDVTVAFAMQVEDAASARGEPLLGLHRAGDRAPRLYGLDPAAQAAMAGHDGSVALSRDGARAVVTGPCGGRAQVRDVAAGTCDVVERADICGVAPGGSGFVFSDGNGGLLGAAGNAVRHPVARDDHLIAIAET